MTPLTLLGAGWVFGLLGGLPMLLFVLYTQLTQQVARNELKAALGRLLRFCLAKTASPALRFPQQVSVLSDIGAVPDTSSAGAHGKSPLHNKGSGSLSSNSVSTTPEGTAAVLLRRRQPRGRITHADDTFSQNVCAFRRGAVGQSSFVRRTPTYFAWCSASHAVMQKTKRPPSGGLTIEQTFQVLKPKARQMDSHH